MKVQKDSHKNVSVDLDITTLSIFQKSYQRKTPLAIEIKDRPIDRQLEPSLRMKSFEAALPQHHSIAVEDVQLLSMNGWLSPDGRLYACRWRQHKHIVQALGFHCEHDMEKANWIKLTRLKWLVAARFTNGKPTALQWSTIEKWFVINEFEQDALDILYKQVGSR